MAVKCCTSSSAAWRDGEFGSRKPNGSRRGVTKVRRRQSLDGADRTEQKEWWPEFCEEVLGYRPEPLAAEVYESADQDAPWLRNVDGFGRAKFLGGGRKGRGRGGEDLVGCCPRVRQLRDVPSTARPC